VSGGWLINKEAFFTAGWVDLLKIRAAYGSVGNRPNTLYPQYDLYNLSGNYNEVPSALISQIGNKDLTWEKTYTLGVGVDFNFLDRFRVSLDYYDKSTDNILFQVPISGLTGVTSIWRNIGKMENRGFEVVLGADIIKSNDWRWTADFNLGLNRNKILELYKDPIISGVINIAGAANRILTVGESSDTWYVPEWAGVNTETGAPQWYKTDGSGQRVITEKFAEADAVKCGHYSPNFFGGFSTSLSWKQFDVNALFGYSVGSKIYNYARLEYDSDGAYTDRNQMKLMNGWSRWTKPGDVATHPQFVYENKSLSNSTSSRYLENGDFLKLRSLSIGYNLPLHKWKIQNLRLSFTAENLFTITNYSGVDPEISIDENNKKTGTGIIVPTDDNIRITGTGTTNYPITRKFMFGINITL
jgi:hypothetical protein